MSHLLSRLVDRAMGAGPVIEPVRSPIFAAAPAGLEQDRGREASGFAYADIISGAQAMHPTAAQNSSEFTHSVSNQVRQEKGSSSPLQPAEQQLQREFSGDNLAAQSLPVKTSEPADSSTLRASPVILSESAAVEPEPRPATLPSPVTPQAPRASDSLSPRDEQRPKAVDMFSARQAFPESPEQIRVESLLRPPILSEPPVSSRQVVEQLPQQLINSQVEQPTIKVTIGRIEVRAMTAPPAQAPQQRKKTQPSLSLDDYLKQRAGGN